MDLTDPTPPLWAHDAPAPDDARRVFHGAIGGDGSRAQRVVTQIYGEAASWRVHEDILEPAAARDLGCAVGLSGGSRERYRSGTWAGAAVFLLTGIEVTLQQKRGTDDFARRLERAALQACGEVGHARVENMPSRQERST